MFGTSGWRGVIGEDFTVLNVHKTVRGIIDMMKTDDFLRYVYPILSCYIPFHLVCAIIEECIVTVFFYQLKTQYKCEP